MRFLIILLLLAATAGLSYWNFFPRGKTGPAALQVFSKPDGAPVAVNDSLVGVTPHKNQNLAAGEVKITVGSGSATFSKNIKLNPKVFTIVNRELAENPFFQAGEILTLEPGTGLIILSTPEGAQILLDDKKEGSAPLHLKDIPPGAHKVVITSENYVSRAVQVQIHANYRLVLDVTLAATAESLSRTLGPTFTTPSPLAFAKVKILATPTGFLRVRDNPTLAGVEIGQVKPGEEYALLEEKPGWFKIRLADGTEGWISAQYAQKL